MEKYKKSKTIITIVMIAIILMSYLPTSFANTNQIQSEKQTVNIGEKTENEEETTKQSRIIENKTETEQTNSEITQNTKAKSIQTENQEVQQNEDITQNVTNIKTTNDQTNIENKEEFLNTTIIKTVSKLNIETPQNGQTYTKTLRIAGWVMSNNPNAIFQILVDNEVITEEIRREKRPDVINAIKGYGTEAENELPGFDVTINISTLQQGQHTIAARVLDPNTGKQVECQKVVINKKNFESKGILHIETPQSGQTSKSILRIAGWTMSNDENAILQILVDNKVVEQQISREKRPDVINTIKGYGTSEQNPTPGFDITLNVSNYAEGEHTVAARILDSTTKKQIACQKVVIKTTKLKGMLNIEIPKSNSTQKDIIALEGWAMSEDKNAVLQVLVDNKEITEEITRIARPDVLNVIKGYGTKNENPTPGYRVNISTKDLKEGSHTITVRILNSYSNKPMYTSKVVINVKKYVGKVNIETPIDYQLFNKSIYVEGWIMTDDANATIQIKMDGKTVSTEVKRKQRTDVINVIKGYGTSEQNPTPGFTAQIDAQKYTNGVHNLQVIVLSKDGEVITSLTRKIKIDQNVLTGIDVSAHNGLIDWEAVKASGIDFAIIRCGYGQNILSQDDKYFERNTSECERLGIPYGVYLYSYAGTREGASSEVEHVLRLIKGKNITKGIWFDMEDADGYKEKNGITAEDCLEVTDEFCSVMKSKGYDVGIYASLYWLNNQLNDSRLDEYPKWVAQWGTQCDYKKPYIMWQYSSSGEVSGINGRVDMNLRFK